MAECVVTGTNSGGFMGMSATNRSISVLAAFAIYTRDGKVKEWHAYFDQVAFQKQLGLIEEAVPA